MTRNRIRAGAVLLAGAAALGMAATPVQAAGFGTPTEFTINTQFWGDPSPIVSASGPLESCTSAVELVSTETQITPSKLLFSGEKQLVCGDGEVVIHYDATLNVHAVGRTFGSWYVVSSTIEGVTAGSGTLKGDSRTCELQPGSDGCILDVFTGRVY